MAGEKNFYSVSELTEALESEVQFNPQFDDLLQLQLKINLAQVQQLAVISSHLGKIVKRLYPETPTPSSNPVTEKSAADDFTASGSW